MDKLTRWLKRHGIDTAFVWTRETVQGAGMHTHVAIHLGRMPHRVRRPMIEWLMTAFDFEPDGINVRLGKYGAFTASMQAGILRYIAKGIHHEMFRYIGFERSYVAAELGIEDRGPQGRISIKRSGASQNIGLAARRAAGWREARTIPDVARLLNPAAAQSSVRAETDYSITVMTGPNTIENNCAENYRKKLSNS